MSSTPKTLRTLGLETLEDRLVLSSNLVAGNLVVNATNAAAPVTASYETYSAVGYYHVAGNLVANGTNAADHVTVSYETYSGVGYYHVADNAANAYYQASKVTSLTFNGQAGDDVFKNMTNLRCTANGGDGNDVLMGGG